MHRSLHKLFPIVQHRLTLRFGTTSLERCLVPSPSDGIKPVIYCTSIRQRERNCFRQLNFMSTMIMEIADESPRAYVPFRLAVKSMSTPRLRRYVVAKLSISLLIAKYFCVYLNYLCFFLTFATTNKPNNHLVN